MEDSKPIVLANQIDIELLLVEAQRRWLRPGEICEILRNYQIFHFTPQLSNRPKCGSLFLFDRKVVRYFSKDDHNWRRKNGRIVEVAHRWLKVGGMDLLHCYNAHGEENENFQSCGYWMLEKELLHIVLVHYREVKTSKNGSSHLYNQPSNQQKYSDSVHDFTSRSHEQEVAGDDLLNSLGPPVTHPNRLARSEAREFEYRANLVEDVVDTADNYGYVTSKNLHIQFVKLLHLSSALLLIVNSNVSGISQPKNKISSLLKKESEGWDQMLKLTADNKLSLEEVKEKLLQKQLKEKLHACLLQKAAEGGKSLSVLDEGGQGLLHFSVDLGYDWALYPTIVAGVNINFRDINGWTALHWAAYCGREHTVAFLLALGAAPGALSDPTRKYTSALTLADLATSIGCIGLASYLAEMDWRSLLSAVNLNKAPNAAKLAALICQALQMLSFQLKEYGDDAFGISDESTLSLAEVETLKPRLHDELAHAAALLIQSKFCSWKCRKDFLISLQQIVKIQAHVSGHQVRKSYKKIVWSLGSLDKTITNGGSRMIDISPKEDDFNFLKGGKPVEERLQKSLFQVTSMVQYPETKDRYQFNGNTFELQTDNYQGMPSVAPCLDFISRSQADKSRVVNDAGFTDEPMIDFDSQSGQYMDMDDFAQGVGLQPLHPSSSSSQPGTPKQGHEMLGQLFINIFGEQESGGHPLIHGESQGTTSTQSVDVASKSIMDYTNEFINDKIFESKEALIQWTRDVSKKNGVVIMTKRSGSGDSGQKARITFGCERGGQYRNHRQK